MQQKAYASYSLVDMTDGLLWKGDLPQHPLNPQRSWAYYNTKEKKSYLYDGEQWVIFSQDRVEGTNMLPQSKMDKLPAKWTGYNNVEIVTEDGQKCAKVSPELNKTKFIKFDITNKLDTINLSQEYTVSAWVKVTNYVAGEDKDPNTNADNPALMFYFDGEKQNGDWLGASSVSGLASMTDYNNQGWIKASYTVKFTSVPKSMSFWLYTRHCTGQWYIRDLKLEKGSFATDWSPAPEDGLVYNIILSNDSATIGTNKDGSGYTAEVLKAISQTEVKVFQGAEDITSKCTYNWVVSGGALQNNNTKTTYFTSLSADTATATVTVNLGDDVIGTKIFTISKNKQGATGVQGGKGDKGDTGAAAVTYKLSMTPNSWNKSVNSSITPVPIVTKYTGSAIENITEGYEIKIDDDLWEGTSIDKTTTFDLWVNEVKVDSEEVTAVENGINALPTYKLKVTPSNLKCAIGETYYEGRVDYQVLKTTVDENQQIITNLSNDLNVFIWALRDISDAYPNGQQHVFYSNRSTGSLGVSRENKIVSIAIFPSTTTEEDILNDEVVPIDIVNIYLTRDTLETEEKFSLYSHSFVEVSTGEEGIWKWTRNRINSIAFSVQAFKPNTRLPMTLRETIGNQPWSEWELACTNIEDVKAFNALTNNGDFEGHFYGVYIWTNDVDHYFYDQGSGYTKKLIQPLAIDIANDALFLSDYSADRINPPADLTTGKVQGKGDKTLKDYIDYYVNASMIQTGSLLVGTDEKPIFKAGFDDDKVKIAGFDVNNNSLQSETEGYVYLGTDAIKLGTKAGERHPFEVNKYGEMYGTSGNLGGWTINSNVLAYENLEPSKDEVIDLTKAEPWHVMHNEYWYQFSVSQPSKPGLMDSDATILNKGWVKIGERFKKDSITCEAFNNALKNGKNLWILNMHYEGERSYGQGVCTVMQTIDDSTFEESPEVRSILVVYTPYPGQSIVNPSFGTGVWEYDSNVWREDIFNELPYEATWYCQICFGIYVTDYNVYSNTTTNLRHIYSLNKYLQKIPANSIVQGFYNKNKSAPLNSITEKYQKKSLFIPTLQTENGTVDNGSPIRFFSGLKYSTPKIISVKEYYLRYNSTPNKNNSNWSTDLSVVSTRNTTHTKLWNYREITFEDGTSTTTDIEQVAVLRSQSTITEIKYKYQLSYDQLPKSEAEFWENSLEALNYSILYSYFITQKTIKESLSGVNKNYIYNQNYRYDYSIDSNISSSNFSILEDGSLYFSRAMIENPYRVQNINNKTELTLLSFMYNDTPYDLIAEETGDSTIPFTIKIQENRIY